MFLFSIVSVEDSTSGLEKEARSLSSFPTSLFVSTTSPSTLLTSTDAALSTSSSLDSSRSSSALKENFQFSKSVSTSTISAKSSFGTSKSLDLESSSKKFTDSDMSYSSLDKGSSSSPLSGFQSPRMHSHAAIGSSLLSKSSVFVKSANNSRSKLTPSSTSDFPSSPIHKFASEGNVDSLRKLIIDLDADVNLPMKDGTTPTHCAAEFGREGLLLKLN